MIKCPDIDITPGSREGTLVPVGMCPGPVQADFGAISLEQLRIVGTYGYVWTSWQRTVRPAFCP